MANQVGILTILQQSIRPIGQAISLHNTNNSLISNKRLLGTMLRIAPEARRCVSRTQPAPFSSNLSPRWHMPPPQVPADRPSHIQSGEHHAHSRSPSSLRSLQAVASLPSTSTQAAPPPTPGQLPRQPQVLEQHACAKPGRSIRAQGGPAFASVPSTSTA